MIKELEVNNQILPYKIINKNNKNTYFRYKDNYLEISKPYKITEQYITEYVTNNFNNFYNKYINHINSIPNDLEIILEEKSYQLIINNKRPFSFEIIDNKLIVNTTIKDITKIKKKIYEKHLLKMINQLSSQIDQVLKTNNIKKRPKVLKYYKSKFGSYHRVNDEITLNIALAKANINYLYYVIMHEYAHTKVFNHSKKFYKVLEKLMPNYKFYDKNIKNISIWL